jgi:voltage-gated potassium channel
LICDPGRVDPIPVKRQKIRERVESKPPTVWRAIGVIVVVTAVFVVLAAVAMRLADPDQFPNMGEALWFSVETVSTVGYGDVVPTTGPGKLVAGVIMMVGLAFVPAVTAIVIATFVARREAEPVPSATVVRERSDPADSERQNDE